MIMIGQNAGLATASIWREENICFFFFLDERNASNHFIVVFYLSFYYILYKEILLFQCSDISWWIVLFVFLIQTIRNIKCCSPLLSHLSPSVIASNFGANFLSDNLNETKCFPQSSYNLSRIFCSAVQRLSFTMYLLCIFSFYSVLQFHIRVW